MINQQNFWHVKDNIWAYFNYDWDQISSRCLFTPSDDADGGLKSSQDNEEHSVHVKEGLCQQTVTLYREHWIIVTIREVLTDCPLVLRLFS